MMSAALTGQTTRDALMLISYMMYIALSNRIAFQSKSFQTISVWVLAA